MNVTLLLTCVGGGLSPQLISSIKSSSQYDVRIIGTDMSKDALGKYFCDVFYTVPSGTDKIYLDSIIGILRKEKVDLVIPTSDEEAVALAGGRENIEACGAKLACVGVDVLKVLSDKAETYKKLASHGVHVPDWIQPDSIESLGLAVREMLKMHGEIVIKPASARGGRGVYVIKQSANGIESYYDEKIKIYPDVAKFLNNITSEELEHSPMIVMERLVEPVYDVDMLAWKGESIRTMPRRRINSADPNAGHVVLESSELFELGERIVDIFGLSWLYDCDVMYDKVGRPCVLEINPRQSGSLAVSIAAGAPMIDDLISLSRGEVVSTATHPRGVRVFPYTSLVVVS